MILEKFKKKIKKPLRTFDKMWSDDPLWLPHVLAGKQVRATFAFGEGDITLDYKIKVQ